MIKPEVLSVMQAGDKCPNCRSGLIERSELGFTCTECSFDAPVEEIVAAQSKVRSKGFRAATIKIRIEDPEEAENFLRGLIVARSNNSSEYFVELIDGVNAVLEPHRQRRLEEEMKGRG